jgi:hypothetical protein
MKCCVVVQMCPYVCVSYVVAILSLGLSGCSSSDGAQLGVLAEVVGKVEFEGKPTPGAMIEFFALEDDAAPEMRTFAVVDADGRFSAITAVPDGSTKGAVPGDYAIAISWSKPLDPTDKDSSMGPELLPRKYNNKKTSGLEFLVKPGKNEIPEIKLVR